jgi:hypothetical protein
MPEDTVYFAKCQLRIERMHVFIDTNYNLIISSTFNAKSRDRLLETRVRRFLERRFCAQLSKISLADVRLQKRY